MTDKQSRIQALIHSIIRYLETRRSNACGVDLTLKKLAGMDLCESRLIDTPPQGTRHDEILKDAIAGIAAPELHEIASCLAASRDDLVWREDNAQFYPPGADLGEGYTKCNLHTLLIGPDACGYHHPDFSLGIFMLGPRTLYRDHDHDAPELYLNLSEKSGWRFKSGEWQDYPAGSLIWNEAGEPHATRVYDQPFISVFVWLENVNSRCNVIHFDDWAEIEKDLAQEKN
ncbi:dimethylsulfonioproprionate lyase family protein [Pseudohalocynthiibacter sp. F2068]|jgi:Dimethlysulfonioproprionate lyase|uniref:dimethylsulfonioproprionate lyase family protein n=1 Tax=Pseudohalocynthiibacter sp. F2068 TaxID=2926418 RepID=UPI001FF3974A|nr:dimethylsulfonioproprionate lyase family protein [Pseudohalocynthiibacter sp. F2068]MCK0104191.1 dimethylsulfoniopropionate lyase [Pseudohalocynthiibacter sp. F2068]